MTWEFSGEIWCWRSPSPYPFVTVPEDDARAIGSTAALVTYGWGRVPATASAGGTEWTTSLYPKDGGYVGPLMTGCAGPSPWRRATSCACD